MNIPLTPIRFKQRALALYGAKTGVVCGDLRLTYSQLFERCDRLSRALVGLGVAKGDRVAYLAYNCHRLLEGYYGVVQMGAILLPLNIRLSPEDFVYILNDSEAGVLFFDGDFRELVEGIRPHLKSVRHFVPLDRSGSGGPGAPAAPTYDELLEAAGGRPFEASEPDEDEVAELFYTSGTTANPKGVMLTHRNLYLHALTSIIAIGLRDTDVQIYTIPLFHVNGWGTPQSLTCVGGTHLMLRKFDPGLVLRMLEEERVTLMAAVPTMANALLHHPELAKHDYSSLRIVNVGGAAPSLEMVAAIERAFGCRCYTGYGLTETSPLLTLATVKGTLSGLGDAERLRRQATTGWPQVGVALRVVGEDGRNVPADGEHIGEILARSDGVMKGYWRKPEETERALAGGWFHTGDMATVDGEGYITIVDRKKDIIISGGENIASIEIEQAVGSHPAVFETAVIGVPDPKWGEVPKALVVLKPGVSATDAEIIEHCRGRLAAFKCPRSVDFFDALPKGGTGKILKKVLREKYWSGEGRRVRG
jgi:fatty-acyl-CoA synthase